MNNYLIKKLSGWFDSFFDTGLFTPFTIYGIIIAFSFIFPEEIIFEDESVLYLQQILRYGATFFLIGWLVGKRIK